MLVHLVLASCTISMKLQGGQDRNKKVVDSLPVLPDILAWGLTGLQRSFQTYTDDPLRLYSNFTVTIIQNYISGIQLSRNLS